MLKTFIFLAALYTTLAGARYTLALIETRRQQGLFRSEVDESEISVLQPILGGDPALGRCLELNLRNAPKAKFIWLLDKEDTVGQEAAQKALLASGRKDVLLIVEPTPPQGLNPKAHKLARGLCEVTTKYFAVLDDDAALPPSALAKAASLAHKDTIVTGLPTYSALRGVWSKLVSGFVNANSAMTYLPASNLKLQKTINGMFSVMQVTELKKRGGFEAIIDEVTDDYALARLFLSNDGRIVQTDVWLSIYTTVESPAHYGSLMRRWMIFASLYLKDNISPGTILLILLPGLLPLPMLITGGLTSPWLVVTAFALLLIKSLLARDILRRLCGKSLIGIGMVYEVLSEIILPLHVFSASVGSQHIKWRTRNFILDGRKIIDG